MDDDDDEYSEMYGVMDWKDIKIIYFTLGKLETYLNSLDSRCF